MRTGSNGNSLDQKSVLNIPIFFDLTFTDFRKQCVSRDVNLNSMKHSPKLMFLNKNLLQKDSNDSGHQKLTLKVRIRDF